MGFIPGGTSDGMAKQVTSNSHEHHSIENAVFVILKGKTRPMDITEIVGENEPDKKIYMFLSLTWAIISDIDLESEVLRWMGSPRLTTWGVWRVLKLRKYGCKFSYNGEEVSNKEDTADKLGIEMDEQSELKSIMNNLTGSSGPFRSNVMGNTSAFES